MLFTPFVLIISLAVTLASNSPMSADGQQLPSSRARYPYRSKPVERPVLKDAFYDDNKSVVRIKTTHNATHSLTCNGVVMDTMNLVLSDISCIKYQGMANIDAKYVQVIAGELGREEFYDVDQIFINKANPNDPSTELALLKLRRPIDIHNPCAEIRPPSLNNTSNTPDLPVRVIGYTQIHELKENRTRIARRVPSGTDKYVCTQPADLNETPGGQLLKGAPLLAQMDCKITHLIGILTRVDTFPEGAVRKHQDCFVMINTQMRWYNQVKTLAMLAAKDGAETKPQQSVVVVTVDDY